MTGAAFTRFQTLRLKKVFPEALAEQLISYGSCQFPTLGFVVERYKQVQAFVPEPFWKLKGKCWSGIKDIILAITKALIHLSILVLPHTQTFFCIMPLKISHSKEICF